MRRVASDHAHACLASCGQGCWLLVQALERACERAAPARRWCAAACQGRCVVCHCVCLAHVAQPAAGVGAAEDEVARRALPLREGGEASCKAAGLGAPRWTAAASQQQEPSRRQRPARGCVAPPAGSPSGRGRRPPPRDSAAAACTSRSCGVSRGNSGGVSAHQIINGSVAAASPAQQGASVALRTCAAHSPAPPRRRSRRPPAAGAGR